LSSHDSNHDAEQDLHLHHLVQPYVDDELSPEEAAMVAAYLERSAAGRAAAMQQREVKTLLRSHGEAEWTAIDPATSARMRSRILGALDEVDLDAAPESHGSSLPGRAASGALFSSSPHGGASTSGLAVSRGAADLLAPPPSARVLDLATPSGTVRSLSSATRPHPRSVGGGVRPTRALLRGAAAMVPAAAAAAVLFFIAARGLPTLPGSGSGADAPQVAVGEALTLASPGAIDGGRLLTSRLPSSVELVSSDAGRGPGGGTVELFDHERGESVLARRVSLRALPGGATAPSGRAWRFRGEVYHVGRDRLGRTVVEFDKDGVRHHLHYVGGDRQRAALVGLEEREPDPTRDEDARALVRLASSLRHDGMDRAEP
jgi:hypothetical protein